MGGMYPPAFPAITGGEGYMRTNAVIGGGPTIVVQTGADAMAQDGILDTMGPMGGRRPPRRNPYAMGGGYMRQPSMGMGMGMGESAPPIGGMGSAKISITKLE
jgi:hypothetical protein